MIVVNTKYESAGRVVLEDALKGIKVARNDRDYTKYDTAIFMSPDSEVKYAKSINPKIKCIIFDPKTNNLEDVRLADELIVSSIEQREFFLKYNPNIKIYYMFPDVEENKRKFVLDIPVIVAYHGNKQHLEESTELIEALDSVYGIQFWAIYNIKKLGMWNKNLPKKCPVKHIQWQPNLRVLKYCDIGVVPSLKPTWKLNNDYVSRYKYSNNPGRIWVFSQLGIPVIADFTPSSCQIIKDGHNGLLVGTKEGWIRAIKMLFDVELRNKLSYNLRRELKKSPNPFK
jgi:glycosyltransferase involved in cell wall biosynthesis